MRKEICGILQFRIGFDSQFENSHIMNFKDFPNFFKF